MPNAVQDGRRAPRARSVIVVLAVGLVATGAVACRRQPTETPATSTAAAGPTSVAAPAETGVAALVREQLDESPGAGRYELLLVLSDGAAAASLHRTIGAGAAEVLTTYRLAGGRLIDAQAYRSTQRLGSGPVTETYASAGTADAATVRANRELVLRMYHEVIDLRQPDAPARYMTEGYIQHNPIIESGRAAIEQFIGRLGPAAPGASDRREELVIADGDFVVMVSVSGGGALRIVDMFRVEAGRVAEHWDFTPVR